MLTAKIQISLVEKAEDSLFAVTFHMSLVVRKPVFGVSDKV